MTVRDARSASTLDVLNAKVLLFQEGALEALSQVLGTEEAAEAA